jgi:hypothetical protein
VERRKLITVREMELQLKEILEVQVLKKRLKEWIKGYQGYRAINKVNKECSGYSI